MVRRKHAEPLGPANNTALEVTQELAALMYAEEPRSIDPVLPAFHAGLVGSPPPDDWVGRTIWESGALAAELIELGGQR